jgi:hypothetical protein
MPETIVNKSGYAAHRKVSPAYVSKLIAQGRLIAPALRADGKIVVELADKMLAGESTETHLPMLPPSGPRVESRAEAEARKFREDADAKAMANAETRKTLCDAASVRDHGIGVGMFLQQALLARRRDLAAGLTAETDFNRVLILIEQADEALLKEFTGNVQRYVDGLRNDDDAAAVA